MPGAGFLDGFSFETLIAPCDGDTFLAEHWGKAPLLERRNLPDFYSGLLSIDEVDKVLSGSSRHGSAAFESGLDIDAALRRMEQGAALILDEAQNQIPALALICRSIQAELGFRCNMSIEVTMASNKPHDFEAIPTHIIVLQISGRRSWRTKSSALPDDFLLQPGDLLYLPHGSIYQHRSTGDESLTALLKITPPRWADMTGKGAMIDDNVPQALNEPLPPGWIHRPRDEIVSELSRRWRMAEDMDSVEAAVARLIHQEVRAFPLDQRGRLLETLSPREIGDDTLFGARRDVMWAIERSRVVARLIAGPATIDLQLSMAEAAAFCLTSRRFRLADLPGEQSPEDSRRLLKTLVRNALIRRISA